MIELTLASAATAFGKATKAKLSNTAISGEPEDQLRTPIEQLISDLAAICGLPADAVTTIGETALGDLKTRPDYAITVHGALAGFIEIKAPGKGGKRIRIELDAARYALGRAEAKWDVEAATVAARFRGEVTLNELRRAKGNLDRTFFLTLFAEFEGILLDYWQDALGRSTKPKVSVLITRIADSCPTPISDAHRDEVHVVRNYRNSLVHSRAESASPLTVAECLTRFGKYLAYLPQQW